MAKKNEPAKDTHKVQENTNAAEVQENTEAAGLDAMEAEEPLNRVMPPAEDETCKQFANNMPPISDEVRNVIDDAAAKQLSAVFASIDGDMDSSEEYRNSFESATESIKEKFGTEAYKELLRTLQGISAYIQEQQIVIHNRLYDNEELRPLIPFLQLGLQELSYKPEYENYTLHEFLDIGFDEHGNPIKDDFKEVIRDAIRRKKLHDEGKYSWNFEEPAGDDDKPKHSPILKPVSYSILNSKPVYKYLTLQEILLQMDADGQYTFLPINHPDNATELLVRRATEKRKEVIDMVSLTYSGDLDGKAAKIKSYDQSVYNGIASLVQAGNNVFLLEDLYKVVTQREKATARQLERFERSLEKFAGTRIKLDVSAEINANMLPPLPDGDRVKNGIIGGALLDYVTYTVITEKGKTKTAVEILKEPLLLYYSRLKNEIISIPVELLELKGNATEDTISIRDYLLREIHQLIRGYRDNNVINYDNLLKHIGVNTDEVSRKDKGKYTAIVCDELDLLREKKHIKGYEMLNGAHNKLTGFRIIV